MEYSIYSWNYIIIVKYTTLYCASVVIILLYYFCQNAIRIAKQNQETEKNYKRQQITKEHETTANPIDIRTYLQTQEQAVHNKAYANTVQDSKISLPSRATSLSLSSAVDFTAPRTSRIQSSLLLVDRVCTYASTLLS